MHKSSFFPLWVTIHGIATCIRKSSQQAVCRFFEALSFTHVGAVPASQVACKQQIFAYVQAQRSNLLHASYRE
jgi:hypothetical protein